MAGRQPWIPNKQDIIDTIYDKNGNVSAIAKKYGVSRDVVHKYIRENTNIQEIIKEARENSGEDDIDRAEMLNRYFMNAIETHPNLASIHCRYILDRKGKKRGWGESDENKQYSQEEIERAKRILDQVTRNQESRKIDETKVSDVSKS